MTSPPHTPTEAITALILDLFRLNNLILTSGDRLVSALGLTSARWQVLGTIVAAARLQPVAWLARDMGANRQNVQRIVNDLAKEGLIEFMQNPHHRRAQLVALTARGEQVYAQAMALQVPWAKRFVEGIAQEDVKLAHRTLVAIRQNLEREFSNQ